MIGKVRRFGSGCGAIVALAAMATPALAALPPYWQSARGIGAIVNAPRVHDALKYGEPIVSITTGGDDVYEVKTNRCVLVVTIVDVPQDKPMVGPRQFDIDVGQADCQ